MVGLNKYRFAIRFALEHHPFGRFNHAVEILNLNRILAKVSGAKIAQEILPALECIGESIQPIANTMNNYRYHVQIPGMWKRRDVS